MFFNRPLLFPRWFDQQLRVKLINHSFEARNTRGLGNARASKENHIPTFVSPEELFRDFGAVFQGLHDMAQMSSVGRARPDCLVVSRLVLRSNDTVREPLNSLSTR